MQPLFELAAEYRAIADKLHELDLDEQTIADTLEGVEGDLKDKAVNVAKYIKNIRASAKARRDAANDIALLAESEEKKANNLEKYLKDQLERAGLNKVDSPWFVISIKQNPASVQIDDEAEIPDDYMREIPAKYSPDKKLIKSALDEGHQVPGCHLARATRIEIK